jgi:hypothetical protein
VARRRQRYWTILADSHRRNAVGRADTPAPQGFRRRAVSGDMSRYTDTPGATTEISRDHGNGRGHGEHEPAITASHCCRLRQVRVHCPERRRENPRAWGPTVTPGDLCGSWSEGLARCRRWRASSRRR